ncbi:MAG TPA: 50S ribosomal protein L23 [Candidatus Sulfotelmatobacter sp.]|nr:50S ribosomal protein L23 [Candidatus Sulfotelmatobacter sp.]
MEALRVIISPLISEKSMTDASTGRYTFKVVKEASKLDIKKAIEEKFKVNVIKLSTVIVKGRKIRTGAKRIESSKSSFKKAVATLKKDQKISIFDTGSQK